MYVELDKGDDVDVFWYSYMVWIVRDWSNEWISLWLGSGSSKVNISVKGNQTVNIENKKKLRNWLDFSLRNENAL